MDLVFWSCMLCSVTQIQRFCWIVNIKLRIIAVTIGRVKHLLLLHTVALPKPTNTPSSVRQPCACTCCTKNSINEQKRNYPAFSRKRSQLHWTRLNHQTHQIVGATVVPLLSLAFKNKCSLRQKTRGISSVHHCLLVRFYLALSLVFGAKRAKRPNGILLYQSSVTICVFCSCEGSIYVRFAFALCIEESWPLIVGLDTKVQ